MRQQENAMCHWTIREIRDEAPRVRSLVLEVKDRLPIFISGQYLTVRLKGFEPAEGKSYSISSSEEESFVRLTIKEMGAFSKALMGLRVGDTLTTSMPYGFFYPEQTSEHELVFIAGGVGIAPCMSILGKLCREGYPKSVYLFYSNRPVADIVFKNELDALPGCCNRFRVTYFISRENVANTACIKGRMTGAYILKAISNPADTDLFICGSIVFTKNLWKELRAAGILGAQIYTEGFF